MCTKNGSYCENEKKTSQRGEGLGWGMCTKNGSYCENEKNGGGGAGWMRTQGFGSGRGSGRGVRVDVNEELKFL